MTQPTSETWSPPVPTYKYGWSENGVFWDNDDYPILSLDPDWLKDKITEALRNYDCHGPVSIHVYGDKNKVSLELQRKFLDAGIKLRSFIDENSDARILSMVVDILLWALEDCKEPRNLFVITKKITTQREADHFESLYGRHYGVLLSDPDPGWELPPGNLDWLLESVGIESVEDKKRKREDEPTHADSED